jgi:hypothetical protein
MHSPCSTAARDASVVRWTMRVRALVVAVVLLTGCGKVRDNAAVDAAADAAGDTSSAPDATDSAPACALQCTIDAVASTTTCAGRVSAIVQLAAGAGTFRLDMNGMNELSFTATICDPTGFVVHVGDSPSNDGGGGDANNFQNDAETYLQQTAWQVFASDFMPGQLASKDVVPIAGCTSPTVRILDQQVHVHGTSDVDVMSPFALRLNPPTDTQGPPDAIWFLGVNRTIGNATRSGTGLSKLDLCLR